MVSGGPPSPRTIFQARVPVESKSKFSDAIPKLTLQFTACSCSFPNCKRVHLTKSFRSPEYLSDIFSTFINIYPSISRQRDRKTAHEDQCDYKPLPPFALLRIRTPNPKMTETGTPTSTGDGGSINGTRSSAPKDKACPFCQQHFTSSSLGRHLDLYIKEKNPKAADGVHDVDEIRKLRGGITRRQPRNSTSRREDSTPAGTPGAIDRRSPERNRSPSLRRESEGGASETIFHRGKSGLFINQGTWESTGVMNNIPLPRNSDARSWDGEGREGGGRRAEVRSRSVSKQILAKSTFEQKQKMMDALDNAKAAELALRELMGSLRAAKYNTPFHLSFRILIVRRQQIEGPSIFDYDPLTLDFPSLCLQCLPAPPTLHSSTPVPSPKSWSLLPPEEPQYQVLRAHFTSCFQRYRLSLAMATTAPRDDLSYPPIQNAAMAPDPSGLERAAANLESQIIQHIHAVFSAWTALPSQKRSELWTLSLARSIALKSTEINKLKNEKELAVQEATHLKQQVDELSRLQHPREFKISPPVTVPISTELIHYLGEMGRSGGMQSIGYNIRDREVHLDAVVERAIGRWRGVVKEARQPPGSASKMNNGSLSTGGMRNQRSLSGESAVTNEPPPSIQLNDKEHEPERTNGDGAGSVGSDQDADADMEEEDASFVEMTDAPPVRDTGFRMANGNSNTADNGDREDGRGGRGGMDGLEGQVVQGYVRIGA